MTTAGTALSVEGHSPRVVDRPASVEELAGCLRSADSASEAVLVAGGRSKVSQGRPPTSLDRLIDTTALDRVVEHAAGDLVVTVQAGVRLADLQAELAGSSQWLALDPPEPDATVGGIVAAAASGPRRLRWGTPRDLVIGMTVVLADGTVARSGGKVVKNVAGYDLGKLFTGSFGTLGAIAEVTFRLHPQPSAARLIEASVDNPVELAGAVGRVKSSGAVPSAIEWCDGRLTVLLEASEPVAAAQAERIAGLIGGEIAGETTADFGVRPWPDRDDTAWGLKLTFRLGALPQAIAAVRELLPGCRLSAHAGSGVIWAGTDAAGLDALPALRQRFADLDGQVVVAAAPVDARRRADVWGPARGLEVMRRVKDRFDPDSRMSPGRFVGGI